MDDKISPVILFEKVIATEQSAKSAHIRLDKFEETVQAGINEIQKDLKTLTAYMNKGKGWAAASLLLYAAIGGLMAIVIENYLKRGN